MMSNILRRAMDYYNKLSSRSKYLLWGYVALHIITIIVVIILTPAYLFSLMASAAESLRNSQYGYIVLFGMILITSFPPIFGYGATISLCGFAYGAKTGWLIAAGGCLSGALLSFIVTRRLLHIFAPMLAQQPVLKGLALAVRDKGTPLVILIRLCPFPFPYSNAFFASIETVSLFQFFLATLIITPKLFLHVWIGSRLFAFADPNTKMDANTKLINGIGIVLSSILGAATSYYVYNLTMKYVREESSVEELENGVLLRDVDEMLGEHDLSDEEEEEEEQERTPRQTNFADSELPPKTRPNSSRTQSMPVPTHRQRDEIPMKVVRRSEDWAEGNFSDFEENDEPDAEEEDKRKD